ncbi:phage portal protein [Arthrobacter sp. zg-Y20]|uniref:phage portal protein n=1 Tax=unclassified Arthrobacter TaxID=235627 RepID=UPI001D135F4F|nr:MULTISPECIES: phage portal protein [unclassified Arthrobacter]MCC3276383.1 phage portal protein [Arthrobacter sp. zg-Y20]MDK1316542.1 phage portal protein [Arthrobacter sp. zg.Y20]WIB06582.1 phage portal protein [Arthrobacter sp. zg-Y20]
MKEALARDYLMQGLRGLSDQEKAWTRRQNYLDGDQDLPYAPEGVSAEYQALREMSPANYLDIAMKAPIQRMQADGFRTHRDKDADIRTWTEIWQPNKLDARQRIVYEQMFVHGRGIMSVSPNPLNRKSPKIRPENAKRVWIEPNPEDPFEPLFAVKNLAVKKSAQAASGLILPASMVRETLHVAYVYTATEWARFEASSPQATATAWHLAEIGRHNLRTIPFVPFDFNVDADGVPHPAIDKLMPQQDAINTIRFNTLLAMQFSAFRQRVFTGYDPVVRDDKGQPLLVTDEKTGKPLLDSNGLAQPVVRSPGRMGVDRALVFPGEQTKVFDLPESNLDNYVKVLQQFLTDFFATGQIPPSYALTKMANLTGDGMAGAESTFQSLIKDIQRAAGEGLESVMRLANVARNEPHEDPASEVIWADTEIRSFAQIVDAIGKLITSGMSRQDAWSFLPSATPPRVADWVTRSDADRAKADKAVTELADRMAYPDA